MKARIFIVFVILALAAPVKAARNFVSASSQQLVITSGLATPPMTFACWFKPANITATTVIMGVFAPSDDGHYLIFRGADAGDPLTATSNRQSVLAASATTGTSGIVADTWYHAAGVFNSTTDRRVFLNGTKFTNATSVSPSGFTKTAIGAFTGSSTILYFSGDIAEAAIWSVSLTDAEVASMAKGASPLMIRPQSLVDYWPLIGRTTNENGIKGNILTNTGTTVAVHPRIYK